MSKVDKNDIFSLYNFYGSYKEYYNYYWEHINQNTITKEDIELYKKNLAEDKSKLGGPIEALCMFAQIPKSYVFNSDDTPKDLNEIEVLDMIMEANYGETND
jgi:hypothetical protein